MKKIFLIGVMGLLLLCGLMIVLPGLLNLNHYKTPLNRKIAEYTGRNLSIKGDVRLSFFPTLTLKADNVSLSNAPGFSSPDMMRVATLSVSLELLPALQGKIVIDSLSLSNPVVFLERDMRGETNWQFPSHPVPSEKALPAADNAEIKTPSFLSRIKKLSLTNATIHYKNGKTDTIINDLTASASISQPEGELSGKASLRLPDGIASGTVTIDNSSDLLRGKQTGLQAEATTTQHTFHLSGKASLLDKKLVLNKADIAMDALAAKGDIEGDFSRTVPVIKAVLTADSMDLTPYFSPKQQEGEQKKSTKKIVKQPVGQWDDSFFDLSFLRKFDTNILLNTAGITLRSLNIGRCEISLTTANGIGRLSTGNSTFYGGTGEFSLSVNASSGTTANWDAAIMFNRANIGRFLSEVASFQHLDGVADSKIQLSSQGNTVKAIVAMLKGQGNLVLHNGALRGINLASPTAKNILPLPSLQQETTFDSGAASFTIEKGIITNNDLLLHTPLAEVTGMGTIDLPQYLIHYRLTPSGLTDLFKGNKIVVTLEGPITAPKLGVDISQLLKHGIPEKKELIDQLKKLRKNKKIQEELGKMRDILGGDGSRF